MLANAQNGIIPNDLEQLLATAGEGATLHFDAFTRSTKRAMLEWIARAKRPETRQRRVARTVECAMRNQPSRT